MIDRGLLPEDETAWLLAIGRRLRAEYAALEEPIPERLAALVARLEKQERRGGAENPRSSADEAAPLSDADKAVNAATSYRTVTRRS
jgi:Anti-sigma factor NepR